MATRPVFIPQKAGGSLVLEMLVDFQWSPGMAPSQKAKNIEALHSAARQRGLQRLLEISSKSKDEVGRRLSAFSLKVDTGEDVVFLESAYQASKVFRLGGPFKDILFSSPLDAKRDPRLKESGELVEFEFLGKKYPLSPKNAFYDWLYLNALHPHRSWIESNLSFDGFTDIEFNPAKSINCQARAFAEMVALNSRGQLASAVKDFSYFASLLPTI